jgi:transposase
MKNNPDKSDSSDAQLIGDLNRVRYLPEVWLAPDWLRDLRVLVRYRHQYVERSRAVKLRIKSLLRHNRIVLPKEYGLWSKKGLSWLTQLSDLPEHSQWILSRHLNEYGIVEQELKHCELRFKSVSAGDRTIQALLKHKGIGLVTAVVMRAEIGVFSRFKCGKQLSKFCGVTPKNSSSGERQADAGLIRAGNPLLKTVIIEAAQRIIRYDKDWNEFAKRHLKNGKPKSQVIAAVANRWMRKLHHIMRMAEDLVLDQDSNHSKAA